MNAGFTLVRCTDPKRWNGFVAESAQGSVFCRTPFLEALGLGHELWHVEESGVPCLGAVVMVDEAGLPLRAPFPFSLYQGLLLDPAHATLAVHRRVKRMLTLVEFALAGLEQCYPRLSFSLHPRFEDVRGLSWFHYHAAEQGRFRLDLAYTGWIALTAFEEFLGDIRSTRRYEYRRAAAAGFTAEPSTDVDLLVTLYRRTFARQGVDVQAGVERRLRAIALSALAEGYGEMLLCRTPAGEPASATLFLFDEHTAYYLIGANDPEHRASGAGTFVLLEHIRRSRMRGLDRVDVCGMNSPNRGDFKASFNAAPVPYVTATWERP